MSVFEKSTTTSALNSIYKTTKGGLKDIKDENKDSVVEKLLTIHGLSKSSFDVVANTESMLEGKLNDLSIDDNSNKNEKTIKGILKEAESSFDKLIGYRYLYRQMKDLYGKSEAKRLAGRMYSYELGLSDSTNIMIPYCWSMDFSRLVTEGRRFGQLQSSKANHISSYISALCESIHQGSNLLAGAIAVGSLFLDTARILLVNEGTRVSSVKHDRVLRKEIENEFQQFIHSVNHLSRNATESPFTNVSILDKPKLENIVSEYEWYFMDETGKSFKNGAVDMMEELQKIFLKVFNAGDTTQNGTPFRFPVVTVNVSKDKENKIVDEKFLVNFIEKHDIYRYNIFCSESTKSAMCCRLIQDNEMMELAAQSNSFGAGSSISLGSHRVVTINTVRPTFQVTTAKAYEEFVYSLVEDAARVLKSHKTMLKDFEERKVNTFLSQKWVNLDRMFSTIGVIGLVESQGYAIKNGLYSKDVDVISVLLSVINRAIKECSAKYGIVMNLEQIPGESFAKRLPAADRIILGDDKIDDVLYSNQFIPLWKDVDVWKKLEVEGKYFSQMTGGGICHVNIGEAVTTTQALQIISHAVKVGCEHFALNLVYTQFEDKSMLPGKFEKHPATEISATDYFTRVIGFFTPVSSWNKERREWEFPKRDFKTIG